MSNLSSLPQITFADKDAEAIVSDIISRYEQITGTTLYPGDPVRLFLETIVYELALQRSWIDNTGKMNLLAYATGDYLDHIGAMLGVYRLEPVAASWIVESHGIRVLNQEPWETLCSFIISQNNNIKRIKGIINRLCENFGNDMGGWYTFPTAEKIAGLSLDELGVLRSGFRAKYILDAAKKVSSGEIDLESLKTVPTDDARKELMKITGVGPKVADCVLLFSLGHTDAFPKDVWIKRAMEVLFGGELPQAAVPYAGIAQQYIFFYARDTKLSSGQ